MAKQPRGSLDRLWLSRNHSIDGPHGLPPTIWYQRGHGRKWQASTAIGAWLDFAGLDVKNNKAIAAFIARFGDPASKLQPGQDVLTRDWATLRSCLAMIAQAWEPAGGDAISRVTDDPVRRLMATEVAEALYRPFLNPGALIPKIDRNGFGLEFQNLGGFMIASAVEHLVDRQPLRRCAVCSRWFPFRRATARFCSVACSAKNARNRKNGQRQKASPEVAGAMALHD